MNCELLNADVCADQRQANATSERPTTTTGVVGGDASRDSPSPSSLTTTSPPPRRRSSPPPPSSSDHVGVHRPHSADVDLLPPRPPDNGGVNRQNGVQHVTQRTISGHVKTPNSDSRMQDESAMMSGGVVRYDSVRFDQRQTSTEHQQQQSQFFRAGQYITSTHQSSSSTTSYGIDSSTVPHHHQQQEQQQQQSSSYPLSYGYDVVAGDARWVLQGQYPRTAFGAARPGVDYTAAGYNGSGGGLVGNAAPTLTRRATVEYRAQPTTSAGPVVGAGVYSMDYPPLHFAPLPFQATAGYGKQNY